MKKIFISYRRATGIEIAGRLNDFLINNGFKVFFDIEKMEIGKQFDKQISDNIGQCDYFILILSKDALNRCVNENDWVRKEIETAFKYETIKIIPIIMRDFEFPNNLPDSINSIRYIHGITYEASMFKLIMHSLLEVLEGKEIATHEQKSEKNKLLCMLNAFYDILVEYREAFRSGDPQTILSAHSSLSYASNFYTFFERHRRGNIKLAMIANEVVVAFNKYVDAFNIWNENKTNQKNALVAEDNFKALIEIILENIFKLENCDE